VLGETFTGLIDLAKTTTISYSVCEFYMYKV